MGLKAMQIISNRFEECLSPLPEVHNRLFSMKETTNRVRLKSMNYLDQKSTQGYSFPRRKSSYNGSQTNDNEKSILFNMINNDSVALNHSNKQLSLKNKLIQEQVINLKLENKNLKKQIEFQCEQNRVQNLLLQSGFSENPITKHSLEYTKHLVDLKTSHKLELTKLKLSFSTQIEDLQETISDMNQSIYKLIDEKNYHGMKFIEIIDKSKEKMQSLKNENKHIRRKLGILSTEQSSLKVEANAMKRENRKLNQNIRKVVEENRELDRMNRQFKKRLYKFDQEDLMVDLDPYEMHRRIRLYESKIELLENDLIKFKKYKNKINTYLTNLNITEKDLQNAMITGKLQLDSMNTSGFDFKTNVNANKKVKKKPTLEPKKTTKLRKITSMRPSSNLTKHKLITSEITITTDDGLLYDKIMYDNDEPSPFKRSLSLGPGDNPKFNPTVVTLKRMETFKKQPSFIEPSHLGEIYIHESIDLNSKGQVFHERLDYEDKLTKNPLYSSMNF